MSDSAATASLSSTATSLDSLPLTPPIDRSHALEELENEYISILLSQLETEDTTEKYRAICKDVLRNGRQRLVLHCDQIMEAVFEEAMVDSSPLLIKLKEYNEKRWSIMFSSNMCFRAFLDARKTEAPDIYEQVLTRTSAYGIPLQNEMLFVTISFLYHLKDELQLKRVWRDLTIYGLKDLPAHRCAQLLIQPETHDSSLRLALQEYYRERLLTLLQKHNISDKRSLYSLALASITQYGWIDGLLEKSVKRLIPGDKFNLLLASAQEIVEEQGNDSSSESPEVPTSAYDKEREALQTTNVLPTADTQMFDTVNTNSSSPPPFTSPIVEESQTLSDHLAFTLFQTPSYDELYGAQSDPSQNRSSSPTASLSPPKTDAKICQALKPSLDSTEAMRLHETELISASGIMQPPLPTLVSHVDKPSIPTQVQSPDRDISYSMQVAAAPSAEKQASSSDLTPIYVNLAVALVVSPQSLKPVLKTTPGSNDDRQLVASCIREKKLQLGDLVQAGELVYIKKTLKNIIEDILTIYQQHRSFERVVNDLLTPIMYLLKRQQNLSVFMKTLFSLSKSSSLEKALAQSLSKISLRLLVHLLLQNSDELVSRVVVALLSKQNPVPLWHLITKELYLTPQIFYLWDMNYPTILSFGVGPSSGKSSLLNRVFMSSFEQHRQSSYFTSTMDIDLGFSFVVKRPVHIADIHGQPTKESVARVSQLFDGFLIQVTNDFAHNNSESLQAFLDLLPMQKFQLVILRDIADDEEEASERVEELVPKSSTTITISELPDLRSQSDTDGQYLIDKLREKIFNSMQLGGILEKADGSMADIQSRRKSKRSAITRLLSSEDIATLNSSTDVICTLKKHLLEATASRAQQNYPIYSLFVESCRLTQQLTKVNFYGAQSETMFPLQIATFKKQKQLENIRGNECGVIFEDFVQLLRQPNTLMNLDILSSELKFEKNLLVGADALAGDLSVEKVLSIEVLWRNAIVCYRYQPPQIQKLIRESYHQYIEAGFPFEIVDGDNFCLHYNFLSHALSHFKDRKVLIVSIIGPQNSGKSTLLNYMFGTLFDVRDGRCTRGIYGSLVKSNSADFDYIMLIDTEGVSGGEKEDTEYDRRIVLFCLAVSHLVIVNIKGELDISMKRLVTLCADSLQNVGVNRVPEPMVHFVLNQKGFSLDIGDNNEVITKLLDNLRQYNLENVIKITKDTFHTLPLAYKSKRLCEGDSTSPSATRTVPDFIEHAQLLCGKLMNSATLCFQKSKTQFADPPQWLNFSNTLFDVLLKFPDLTYFVDIHEKNQDLSIREFIRGALEKKLTVETRHTLIAETLAMSEGQLNDHVQLLFDRIAAESDEELESILKSHQASKTIRERAKEFMNTQLTGSRIAWRTSALQENDRVSTKDLWHTGGEELKAMVNEMVNSRTVETRESAEMKFERMWKSKVTSIRKKFNEDERLQTAMRYIFPNYNSFEQKNLPSNNYIIKFLSGAQKDLGLAALKKEMRQIFIDQVQDYAKVEDQQKTHANQIDYSLDMIMHLKYLNKTALLEHFTGKEFNNRPAQQPKASGSTGGLWSGMKSLMTHLAQTLHWSKEKEIKMLEIAEKIPACRRPSNAEFRYQVRKCLADEPLTNSERNILPLLADFDYVYGQIINLLIENGSGIAPIDIDIIQKIVALVNTTVKEVDLELNLFDVSLSKHASSSLHSVSVLLLTKLYFKEQKEHFDQQIETLNRIKGGLKSYLIRMVVPNMVMDIEFTESATQQIHNLLVSDLREKAKAIISEAVKDYGPFTRQIIQGDCDNAHITSGDLQWHIDYIVDPTKVILEAFGQKWDSKRKEIEQQIEMERNRLCDLFTDYVSELGKLLQQLKLQSKSGTAFIDDSFLTDDGTADKNLIYKGTCMSRVLYSYLSNQPIKESYTIDGIKFTLQNHDLYQSLSITRSEAVTRLMNREEIKAVYEQCSISNLFGFLEKLIESGTKCRDIFAVLATDFVNHDSDDTYRKLMSLARGCAVLCPCCSRQCDADHTKIKSEPGSEFNKHCCKTGHQFRCMGGFKMEITNESSVKMCEEMKDDDMMVTNGNLRISWAEFKSQHKEWEFGNEQSLTAETFRKLRLKYTVIWERIGETFCRDYFPGMVFVMKNHEPAQHFILLLDQSGSMKGERWLNLTKAVEKFAQIRKAQHITDRISVIIFGKTASFACINEELKSCDVLAKIKAKENTVGSGTDFAQPLSLIGKAIETSDSNKKQDTRMFHSVIFLTDGEADFPEKELKELSSGSGKNISNFWSMGLGNSKFPVLERINQKMSGQFINIENSSDLVTAYAEIALGRPAKKT